MPNDDGCPPQMKCCGVVNAKDWQVNVTAPKWEPRCSLAIASTLSQTNYIPAFLSTFKYQN